MRRRVRTGSSHSFLTYLFANPDVSGITHPVVHSQAGTPANDINTCVQQSARLQHIAEDNSMV
eukprot:4145285-Alexandrium_andersonii.AAC.1